MLKLGNQSISALYLGGTEVKKAYLGDAVVFDVTEPPVPTYTISASIDPDGSGTVTGAGTYQAGETVTITAAPGEGYQFTGWQENGVVVSEEEAYTFTVAGDRALVAVFEAEEAGLPAGYTQLEYLESPARTTGFNYRPYISVPATTDGYAIEIKVVPTVKPSGNYGAYFIGIAAGSTTSSLVRAIGFQNNASYANSIVVRQGTYNLNNGSAYFANKLVLDQEYTFKIYPSLKKININGTDYSYTAGSSVNWAPLALNLFTIPELGNSLQLYCGNLRMYHVTWYDINGKIVRNLVPAKNPAGNLGMFDTVSKVFYTNANTSSNANNKFIAGPAV